MAGGSLGQKDPYDLVEHEPFLWSPYSCKDCILDAMDRYTLFLLISVNK
jgi:hypothetical protein